MHSAPNLNPYAQGGWYNPENPMSINAPVWNTPAPRQPSVLGALPVMGSSALVEAGRLTFRLSPAYPDILNCFLYTFRGEPYLEVVTRTRPGLSATTYFRKGNEVLASIEWGLETTVDIPGIVPAQTPVDKWLSRVNGQQRWMMYVKDRPFTWIPQGGEINLFAIGSIIQQAIAKTSRAPNSVTLQLTSEAIQVNLLESSIVATVLLYSGRI